MRIIVFFYVCISLLGCTPNIRPYSSQQLDAERIFDKNYEIFVPKFAYVGQPMVKVRDYNIFKWTTPKVIASRDSIISGGILELKIDQNRIYNVIGEVEIDSYFYPLVAVSDGSNGQISHFVAIKSNGEIQGSVYGVISPNKTVTVIYTFKATNDLQFKFIERKSEVMSVEKGDSNYELIYSGTSGSSFFINYREYTKTNFARDAFYQRLVYDHNSKKIRFKDIEINVESVTNEKINFTVISDGL